ncbi:hypothetical protein V9K30_003236 [Vibrio cholerae]|nr:hypothetical protein [Vibrio cholerae]EKF9403807.1 hypothetical protein [Vibrio cholerae]EKF9627871.1 hypothetical protein [Vibrio cholerae]EKF9648392.1 hypothetical protein [Vibrio cholerae]EKF9651669.1 hypothetical protein [Vibrio cholerae]
MPLPLLVPIVAGIAGVYGAGKAAKAASDSSKADKLNDRAEGLVSVCQRKIESSRVSCNESLEELGQKKYDAISKTLSMFVEEYGKLKNVTLTTDKELSDFTLADFNDHALEEMRSEVSMLTSSALGVGSGAIGGGMAAFGAYSGTMMLASAGTGTAIGSLSGAAATNATMAWLGGGTLASGGFGMAGGAVVLGTLAAGPALLIFGSILGAKAESKLNDAKANLAQARAFEAESEAVITKLEGISEVANLATDTLSKLRTLCRRSCKAMASVISSKGIDYSAFSEEERAVVFKTVKLAQLVKVIIDTAILDEEGNLLNDASANINKAYGSSTQLV